MSDFSARLSGLQQPLSSTRKENYENFYYKRINIATDWKLIIPSGSDVSIGSNLYWSIYRCINITPVVAKHTFKKPWKRAYFKREPILSGVQLPPSPPLTNLR